MYNKKESVALSSVFASAFLTVMKFMVGILTGSLGIISEGAHSLLDFGAALLTYFAVKVGDKPADRSHPYGHAKIENVSALIETGLLFLTSIWIIYEAIKRLFFHNVEVEVKWYSFVVIIVAIIVDYSRSRALTKVAKETGSQALEADALHFSSDILSSIVVLIGLIFVSFGLNIGDAIASVGVSFFILHAGYKLGKRTIDVLVDAAPEGLTDEIVHITKKVKEVIQIEKIRVRPVGATTFVDMTVSVSRLLSLEKANEVGNLIRKNILKSIPQSDITIHTKPLSLNNETILEQVKLIALNLNLDVHDIVVHEQEGRKYLSFDLEVGNQLTIKKAHDISTKFEDKIKKKLGIDLEINAHIEPLESKILQGKSLSPEEQTRIETEIKEIVRPVTSIKGIHKILLRQVNKKLFITLHCSFDDSMKLEEVHHVVTKLEYLILDNVSHVERVVVHPEPEK